MPKSTRVTVLEQNLASQGKTPRTAGGTALPYSPYMPFSPITPITPRLLSRRERKEMQKAEGREVVKEMAKAEGELWDSGY